MSYTNSINKYHIITRLLCLVVLPQRDYYVQSCYRNETIMFSRAIATRLLCSVVLSQRHYYIQSCYRNDMIFNQKDEVRMCYLFMELVL